MAARTTSADEVKSSMYIDIETVTGKWLPEIFRMHKVSPQLRMRKAQFNNEPSVYDPISVSLGPYHHGKQEFSRAEEFKYLCLHWCANGDNRKKDILYNSVFYMVGEIRRSYADDSILDRYDDCSVALMMLLDGCFIINFMRMSVSDEIAKDSYNCMGLAGALPFAARDIMLLENQIPFFVLKLLLDKVIPDRIGGERRLLNQVMQDMDGAQSLLASFFNGVLSVEKGHAEIPHEDEFPPIHLLEASRRVLIGMVRKVLVDDNQSSTRLTTESHSSTRLTTESHSSTRLTTESLTASEIRARRLFRKKRTGLPLTGNSSYANSANYITCPSVTYLKSKGIHFRPSHYHFLKDIKFTSGAFSGLLQLPICYASNLTFVFLSNMIAYEVAPGNVDDLPDLTVLSYVSLMKSLIQTPADVIELQEKGILRLNRFANHEQVVQIFKSIETFNLRNVNLYQDVMYEVGEHCNSMAKSWTADLINGKLKNPWTIIALLSATFLLILTFLQTYYTIRSSCTIHSA